MMRVSGPWLTDSGTQKVFGILTEAGYQALFVGGCVRNAILGAPVRDLDISTDALPETVTKLANSAGLRVVPTGIEHGTVTIVSGRHAHEVTTFRKDIATDGRRAVVAFTTRIEEDALRRDLTMNALYARADGRVIDPLGGLDDLLARRVRFIQDPEARIREDYLRILRFFRFHAWYGDPEGGLDREGLAACAALADGLMTLSKERIGAELLKLLAAPDPGPAAAAMQHAGCLARILPGADTRYLPILMTTEAALDLQPDAIRRLTVIGGEDQAKLLRLSKKDAARLKVLTNAATGLQRPAELGYRLGATDGLDAIALRSAFSETPVPPNAVAACRRGATATFPVRAADLMHGYSGAALGRKLAELESAWIASDFSLTRAELLA